jgi:hypothetical protein
MVRGGAKQQGEKNILERICNGEIIEHYETVRTKKNG